ncbi:MAG: A/G-specific adenine glycosylase [Eubacterium sp.]|jgi:A/G-specific adenine glycosylase|nr:A/G-specific adenine glycosylase [Eubacterium sp.]
MEKSLKTIDSIYKQLPNVLLPWYKQNARQLPWRKNTDPYHVWLSEIMLQQTRVEAVWTYYLRFLEQLPDIRALAEVPENQLFKLWEGLGYYNRARNLQKAARIIETQYGGRFPNQYEDIRALPGIGPYTAGAIASICFNQPYAAVDGNVLRIITRITENNAPIDCMQTKNKIAEQLEKIYPKDDCGQFTQALMELGATVCTPKSPKCTECPANGFCLAYANGAVLQYPVKQPKKDKRLEERTVFLLQCGDSYALTKRTESGLLSGLWQLPNVLGKMDVDYALHTADSFGVQPVELYKQIHRVHIFTHIKWQMTCYHILCAQKPSDFVWATAQELQTTYALPTAFRMFFEALNETKTGNS